MFYSDRMDLKLEYPVFLKLVFVKIIRKYFTEEVKFKKQLSVENP